MPDDRLFHKKLGHSVKVNSLTADEEIVWRTYVLAADDFGVMRFSADPLRDAHERLQNGPEKWCSGCSSAWLKSTSCSSSNTRVGPTVISGTGRTIKRSATRWRRSIRGSQVLSWPHVHWRHSGCTRSGQAVGDGKRSSPTGHHQKTGRLPTGPLTVPGTVPGTVPHRRARGTRTPYPYPCPCTVPVPTS